MKRYILGRIIRAILSIIAVVTLVSGLVYTCIPRERIFYNDPIIDKISHQPDDYLMYQYRQWEELGYVKFDTMDEFCEEQSVSHADQVCMSQDEQAMKLYVDQKEQEGYTVGTLPISGKLYAYKDVPFWERLFKWWTSLVDIDHPYKVVDDSIQNRGLSVELDDNDRLALMCVGCEHKYLIYFTPTFPFVHQNMVSLNLGQSYPTYQKQEVLDVLTQSQGAKVQEEVIMPNGETITSSIDLYSCRYKPVLNKLEEHYFTDQYADCEYHREGKSMIDLSFIMGLISIGIVYFIAIPSGVFMVMLKGKWFDKMGTVYIVTMMAIPSLAYISLVRFVGSSVFNLPGLFPLYGDQQWQSYVLPIVSLTLGQLSGLMMWSRRYMLDQSQMEYVRFAKAKGLPVSYVMFVHVLKNALGPIIHGIPGTILFCMSGALMTEAIYAIPGMGKMLPDALSAYNNTMIVGLTFIYATLAIISSLLGDLLLAFVDPRIKLEEERR